MSKVLSYTVFLPATIYRAFLRDESVPAMIFLMICGVVFLVAGMLVFDANAFDIQMNLTELQVFGLLGYILAAITMVIGPSQIASLVADVMPYQISKKVLATPCRGAVFFFTNLGMLGLFSFYGVSVIYAGRKLNEFMLANSAFLDAIVPASLIGSFIVISAVAAVVVAAVAATCFLKNSNTAG